MPIQDGSRLSLARNVSGATIVRLGDFPLPCYTHLIAIGALLPPMQLSPHDAETAATETKRKVKMVDNCILTVGKVKTLCEVEVSVWFDLI